MSELEQARERIKHLEKINGFYHKCLEVKEDFENRIIDGVFQESESYFKLEEEGVSWHHGMYEMRDQLVLDIAYKKTKKWSTFNDEKQVKKLNSIIDQLELHDKALKLERLNRKVNFDMLNVLCEQLINVIDSRIGLPKFVDKAIVRLKQTVSLYRDSNFQKVAK